VTGYRRRIPDPPPYLKPGEVADLFHVNVKTVNRWAKEGKLPHLRTLGGHRRYDEATVRELAESLKGAPDAG
jgi:excisionase family DNA binding protein